MSILKIIVSNPNVLGNKNLFQIVYLITNI